MSPAGKDEQWRPDERPDQAPTHPYDPDSPDPHTEPLPLPGHEPPISEPDNPPDTIGDSQRKQPLRI